MAARKPPGRRGPPGRRTLGPPEGGAAAGRSEKRAGDRGNRGRAGDQELPSESSARTEDPVRGAAVRLLMRLEHEGHPMTGDLEEAASRFSAHQDRQFLRSLFLETVRHRRRLDHVLQEMLERPLEAIEPPVRNVLRLGATELLVLRVAPHAAVDTSVTLARRRGHRGTAALVNAVLRRVAREGPAAWSRIDVLPDTVEGLSVRYSHPAWLVARWLGRWGPQRTRRMLAWNNSLPDYWLRLEAAEGPPEATPGWIPGTARVAAGSRPALEAGFTSGQWTIQDGSAIVVGMLPPEVSGRVLEMAAAPGTKTTHLYERAADGTMILALDRSSSRLRKLAADLAGRRAVRGNDSGPAGGTLAQASDARGRRILLAAADGRNLPAAGPFNLVLLDAPCSNLGVIRRRIDVKWRARESEIERLAALQRELLASAVRVVAPGGWLVYSVCTVEPEEPTRHYDALIAEHPDLVPAEFPAFLPQDARLRPGEMLLLPGEHETDGTYALVLQRRG